MAVRQPPPRRPGARPALPLFVAVTCLAGGIAARAARAEEAAPPAIPGVQWLDARAGELGWDVVVAGIAQGRLPERVLLNARDASNYLELGFAGGKAQLARVFTGARTVLGEAALPEGYEAADVVAQWRHDRLRVISRQQVLLEAYEHGLVSGRAGYAGDVGKAQVVAQPVDAPFFTDDFGRLAAEMGDWAVVSGGWGNVQSEGEAKDSANPFAFEGKPGTEAGAFALATSGSALWSDYWMETALRSEGASAMGIMVLCSATPGDAKSVRGLLVRWTSQTDLGPDGDRVQLVSVRDGQRTVLAEKAGGFAPQQWYRMRVAAGAKGVSVWVDGAEVLHSDSNAGFGRGQIGLFCEGAGAELYPPPDVMIGARKKVMPRSSARFDDVAVGALDPGRFTFPGDLPAWRTSAGVVPSAGGKGAEAAGGKGGFAVLPVALGDVDLSVDLGAAGDSGEVDIGYRGDDQPYWAARWAAGDHENVRLVSRKPDGETVLATASTRIGKAEPYRLRVVVRDDLFRVSLNDATVIEATDDARLAAAGENEAPDSSGAAAKREGAVALRFGTGVSPAVRSVALDIPQRPKSAIITEQFTRETGTMSEWATTAGSWIDPSTVPYAGGVWWGKGDLYGDVEVRMVLQGIKQDGTLSLYLAARDWKPNSGYELKVKSAEGGLGLELLREGQPFANGQAQGVKLPQTLIFQRRGGLLTTSIGGHNVMAVSDPAPETGTKLGLKSEGVAVEPNTVYAFSMDTDDYTFSVAPSDWVEEMGTWELSSRWTCSKQWSWWSGRSEEGALMWSKAGYRGDVTVELYAAMKMGIAEAQGRSYKHPHDVNICLFGDGKSISTGYNFVVGGARDIKTQIWSGGKLLAETGDAGAMLPRLTDAMPSMNEFHRKWWQVRAEKQGNRLRLYLDNRLALEATDPEPIYSGHVGIWTWNNGIMVARAKVYGAHSGAVLAPRVSRDFAKAMEQRQTQPAPIPYLAPAAIRTTTHPSRWEDFETGLGSFETWRRDTQSGPGAERYAGAEQAAVLVLDPGAGPDGTTALKLVKEHPGGNFGASALREPFTAAEYGVLGFDYRMGPDVKVDVLLRGKGRDYVVRFTGDGRIPPSYVDLGRIEGVATDGKWHRATFDMRGHMVERSIDPAAETVNEIVVGSFSTDKWLAMGVTGNPAGAAWWLDNFGVYSPGPSKATFAWEKPSGAASFRWAITTKPGETPPEGTSTTDPTATADQLAPGAVCLHVAALDDKGQVMARIRYPFSVARDAPTADLMAGASPTAGGWVHLGIGGVESGLDPKSVKLTVGGREATLGTAGTRYEAAGRQIAVDLDQFVAPEKDGVDVPIALTGARTYAGRDFTAGPFPVTIRRTLDTTPPPAPRVEATGAYLVDNDFESDMGQWTSDTSSGSGYAALSLDSTTAAGGARCLRLTKTSEAGQFGAWAIAQVFDAGQHRLLSFDYRMDPWVRVDLALVTAADGKPRLLKMTDNDQDGYFTILGRLPIQADGKWHHIDIDLLNWLQQADPTLGDYRIAKLGFRGGGWDGNPEGTFWQIDNFHIAGPVAAGGRLVLHWLAPDSSGLAGASYILDDQPTTEPAPTVNVTGDTLALDPPIPTGWRWFHVRVVDSRGNWSETTHHEVLLDATGPIVGEPSIADGARLCTDHLTLTVLDPSGTTGGAGVDPRSIRLRVGDDTYAVDRRVLTYSSRDGTLVWNGQARRPKPRTFASGENVYVCLDKADDYAGNPVQKQVELTFTMDFSLDKEPPARPAVQSQSHPTAVFEPYETNTGGAQAISGAELSLDPHAKEAGGASDVVAGLGASSLRIERARGGGQFSARIFQGLVDLAAFPVLSFDYRCPPETRADLVFEVAGRPIYVTFTDGEAQAGRRVAGVAADNQWHHAELQLVDVARDVFGDQRSYLLTGIALADLGNIQTPVGSAIWIDNLWLRRGGQGRVRLSWDATDPTGIVGYATQFDRSPFTVPDENVTTSDSQVESDRPAPGAWFMHVRALDGAGHWSDTAHLAIWEQP